MGDVHSVAPSHTELPTRKSIQNHRHTSTSLEYSSGYSNPTENPNSTEFHEKCTSMAPDLCEKKNAVHIEKITGLPDIVERIVDVRQDNKRVRSTMSRSRKRIFVREAYNLKLSWSPKTKLGNESLCLLKHNKKKFKKLGNAEQGLLVAFLCNRFPGGGKICRKCDTGERVTRGHLKRCHYSKEYFKKVRYKNFEKHIVSYFRLFGRIKKMI